MESKLLKITFLPEKKRLASIRERRYYRLWKRQEFISILLAEERGFAASVKYC